MDLQVAEVFHPGEYLKDELDARKWTQAEFAEIIGRPPKVINQIISGKLGVTPETAVQLAKAFGTSPELWINLQTKYLLSKVKNEDNAIERKSFLSSHFPIREMIKRGWLVASENIGVLEQQVKDFFELDSLDAKPTFAHSAKKTSYTANIPTEHLAWLFKAKRLAQQQIVKKYNKDKLLGALEELSALLLSPEETRHVQKILSESGVRLLFVESLPASKIDGACFWLDANKPVIVLSLRLDRIDNFWFVLRHEIEHIIHEDNKDAVIIDEDVGAGKDLPFEEIRANQASAAFCVDQTQLDNYIARTSPYVFTEIKVLGFAKRLNIHPGIVVGQLQHKFEDYKMLRKHLAKVRHIILENNTHDGWGN